MKNLAAASLLLLASQSGASEAEHQAKVLQTDAERGAFVAELTDRLQGQLVVDAMQVTKLILHQIVEPGLRETCNLIPVFSHGDVVSPYNERIPTPFSVEFVDHGQGEVAISAQMTDPKLGWRYAYATDEKSLACIESMVGDLNSRTKHQLNYKLAPSMAFPEARWYSCRLTTISDPLRPQLVSPILTCASTHLDNPENLPRRYWHKPTEDDCGPLRIPNSDTL